MARRARCRFGARDAIGGASRPRAWSGRPQIDSEYSHASYPASDATHPRASP
jgi:hypothetical protein